MSKRVQSCSEKAKTATYELKITNTETVSIFGV